MLCPACENESENTQQCTNCGWLFVYFTQEPTKQEQNEYTSLLQNYRTELYFNLAQQYYEKEQFEETIQCCMISCEHQLYENPLVHLALSHQALNNHEEALKYVNMAIEINPNNEIALNLLAELNLKLDNQNEIIKLTPEILEKGMFETTEEYQDRIKNLSYVAIGHTYLGNYDADLGKLKFTSIVDDSIKTFYYQEGNLGNANYGVDITPQEAKYLYSLDSVPLIAKIEILNNKLIFTDIKIDTHTFFTEFSNNMKELDNEFDKFPVRDDDVSLELYVHRNSKYSFEEALAEIRILKEIPGNESIRIPSTKDIETIIKNEKKLNINTHIIFKEPLWTDNIEKKDPNDKYDDPRKRIFYGMKIFTTGYYDNNQSHTRARGRLFYVKHSLKSTSKKQHEDKSSKSFFNKLWS